MPDSTYSWGQYSGGSMESGMEPDAQAAELLETLETQWKEASAQRAEYADPLPGINC